ncbi:DNA polymerase phi-domain-containing protein [Mrakia frigida]|uniref:DNA-directed DNA polymerase n=1 Tax=Mrakia frigida TaxID=29902 RepID=UPI003FCC090C
MSTTLPLFWDLSSSSKQKRLKSSAELITTLQHFQSQFAPSTANEDEDDDEDSENDDDSALDDESGEEVDGSDDGEGVVVDKEARKLDKELDRKNSEDVRYSIRRLVRGLASPRESSRLGFAVALTELLSRLTTITPKQIISLVLRASLITVSSKGQETRDLLFARLFGLTSVVQSSLLYRPSATIEDFKVVVQELIEVGKQKAWLRESCWWAVIKAVEGLEGGEVEWRKEAGEWVAEVVFADQEGKMDWTPEKVALGLKMQGIYPTLPWKTLLLPPFKNASLLHPSNLPIISRILKEASSAAEDEDEAAAAAAPSTSSAPNKNGTGSWKPHPHFVWDMILDAYFPKEGSTSAAVKDKAAFSDFYRVVVDESLFDVKTSSERKFWGFQIFEKALPRLPASEIPLVFTPNFMRVWINNLSGEDRYLHKAALSIAKLVQTITVTNPAVGFTLVSQLLGKNGNQNFDKITKTKTVSGILSSLSVEGVREYVVYLKGVVYNSLGASEEFDLKRIEARRTWAFDQMLALIKNGSIPKEDTWVLSIIEFFVLHGLFAIKQANKKSTFVHLQSLPTPSLSDSLHAVCRTRLSSVLGELTSESSLIKDAEGKTSRVHGSDSTGTLWISRALDIVYALEKDTKHVTLVTEEEGLAEDIKVARKAARDALVGLASVPKERKETAKGLELLIQSVILQSYDEPEESIDVLEELQGCAAKMFAVKKPTAASSSTKKPRKTAIDMEDEDDEEPEDLDPMDLLVDVLIGFLERASSQLRALASQVFGMLSGEVTESTVDLLLAQLETRPVTADEEDEEMDGEDEEEGDDDEEEEDDESEEEEEEEEETSGDVDPELRKRIAEALQVNGADAVGGGEEDSDEEDELLMDDDQMLALDDKLAEIFKSQVMGKKGKKDAQREAVHFKNRVLDIIETFVKKQPSNPLILRLVLPLLEIILNSGPTELHLSSKATGILANRICKSKDAMLISDRSEAVEVLGELHQAARKAQSAQVAKTCSQASVFVARALLQDQSTPSSSSATKENEQPILDVYLASLEDFMTKKTTKVKASLFFDLVARFPVTAWSMRDQIIQYAKSDGANGYRQTQAFLILNELVGQVPALSKAGLDSSIQSFVPVCREAIYSILSSATDSSPEAKGLKADRLRDIAKFAVKLARSTSTVVGADNLASTWAVEDLTTLASKLKAVERLKGSGALHAQLSQLVEIASGVTPSNKKGKKSKKEEVAAVVVPEVVAGKVKKGGKKEEVVGAPKRKLKKSAGDEAAAGAPEKKRKKKTKVVEEEAEVEMEE